MAVRNATEQAVREARKRQMLIIAQALRKTDKSPDSIEKFVEKLEEEGCRDDD